MNKYIATTRALTLAVSALLAGQSASAFTIITNEGFTAINDDLPTGYGDNVSADTANYTVGLTGSVTGTPDITLDLLGGFSYDTYTDWD